MDPQHLANFVKQKLFQKKVSGAEAARQSGIGAYTMHTIMTARLKNPTLKTLETLANFLNCSVFDLLGFPNIEHKKRSNNKKKWEGYIYSESARVLGVVLSHLSLSIEYDQALEIIEEIYDFYVKTGNDKVEFPVVRWHMEKYLENNKNKPAMTTLDPEEIEAKEKYAIHQR